MAVPALRRATLSDAAALARLGERTFRETFLAEGFAIPYPADDLQAFLDAHFTPAAFAARLGDGCSATWLAEADGAPLAYAVAGPCHLPHPEASAADAELHRLYVLKDAQGLGLGRRLMDTALAWMDDFGGASQWIGVWSGNPKAQRFYAAHGFQRVGGYAFPVGRWRDEELILRRPALPARPARRFTDTGVCA